MCEIISPFGLYEKLGIQTWDDRSPNRLMPNASLSEKGERNMEKELVARIRLLEILDEPTPVAIYDEAFSRKDLVGSIVNLRHRIEMAAKW